jgi:hypothetical protein
VQRLMLHYFAFGPNAGEVSIFGFWPWISYTKSLAQSYAASGA